MITGELRHRGVRHGVHHLGAILGDAPALVLLADHEPGDVLQKHERNATQVAELHEVRRLQCRLGKEHAVIGDDPDQQPMQTRKARDDRRRVSLFEFVQARAIHETRNDLPDVVRLPHVGADHAVQLLRVVGRLFWFSDV
jgi:hypothetical protein